MAKRHAITRRNRLSRALGIAMVGATVAWPAAPAAAQAKAPPAFYGDNAFAKFALPYMPYVFDLVVYFSRNLAEVTYDQRSYDPITETFVVNGLRVQRDALDLSIQRLRVSDKVAAYEGVSIDTRRIDLPPEVRERLQRLGHEVVTGDIVFHVRTNEARAAFDFDILLDFKDIGALAVTATIDNFHFLLPLEPQDSFAQQPVVVGSLYRASVAYEDHGLADVLYELAGETQGVTAEEFQAGLAVMPAMMAGQMLSGLEGGASPELNARLMGWSETVQSFLADPDVLRVTFEPVEPVALSRFQEGRVDEGLINALNPSVSDRFFPVPAALSPEAAGPVETARLQITGVGMPQDIDAGLQTLLEEAAEGNLDAVRTLGEVFEANAGMIGNTDWTAEIYEKLLVARALGTRVSDGVLSSLASRLDPEAVMVAEDAARRYWASEAGDDARRPPLTAAGMEGISPNALRSLAFDYYEGRSVPRDFTEAYALALVAAAAGDPIAAALRDDLREAAGAGRIVLADEAARLRADELWEAYAASIEASGTADAGAAETDDAAGGTSNPFAGPGAQ